MISDLEITDSNIEYIENGLETKHRLNQKQKRLKYDCYFELGAQYYCDEGMRRKLTFLD